MVHKSGPNMKLNDLHSGKEKTITLEMMPRQMGRKSNSRISSLSYIIRVYAVLDRFHKRSKNTVFFLRTLLC